MRSFASVAALSCLSLGALAKPTPRPAPVEIQTNEDASDAPWDMCGRIVSAANEGQYIFYARDAIRCLTSVPFNAAVASRFIEYYNTTMQFQSTLAYLKNPPEGYQQPAIDVVAGLQQIQDNIDNGKYKNQYAFEAEMQALVYSMHDMHVDLNSGVLSAFSFASPYYITSASVDGKQDPEIYLWDDVWERTFGGPEPSAVAAINGRDVIEVLTEFAALNSQGTLEPHADWNQLFSSPAQDIQGALNVFSGGATFYPGDELEFKFKNGSTISTNWIAIYNNPYDTGPLTTGGDFYNYFVLRQYPQAYYDALDAAANSNSTDDSTSDDSSDDSTSDDTYSDDTTSDDTSSDDTSGNWNYDSYGAYPDNPDIVQPNLSIESGGVLTGYFFNESSTAVLSIPSFDQYDDNIGLFDETVGHFVNNATERNLTRCVIDLQQNSGGLTLLAFITFAWFFPQTTPFHGSRRRSFDLANSLGSFTTDFWSSLQPGTDDYDDWYDSLASDEWVVTDRLDADTGLNFTSWSAFYGPRHYNDDDFSLTEQYNLSSPVFADTAFNGWFLNPEQWGSAPWRPDQILLLTDGTCSSTCALFVELMTQQYGVRTLAVGGRPGAGPMQTASGSRGALEYTANDIDIDIDWVNGRMDLNDNAGNESAYGNLRPLRERDSGMWVSYAGFNLRDQIRENDTTPLQFKYEAANCRMYYTLDNVWNMTRLWLDAAAATWDDVSGGSCVANSTGYSSTSSVSTAQPPPPLNISVPTINDDFLSNTADYVISSADEDDGEDAGNRELTAGTAAVSSTTLQLCTSAGKCPAGLTGTCEEIQIQCPGAKTPVKRNVCMTRCSSVNRGADCSASGTGCTGLDSGRNNRVTSTSNSGSTGGSLAKEFNRNVGRGYCKPKITPVKGSSAVKALACPK